MPLIGLSLRVAAVLASVHAHEPIAELQYQCEACDLEGDCVALMQMPSWQEHPGALPLHVEGASDAMRQGWMMDSLISVAKRKKIIDQIPAGLKVAAASTAASVFTTVNDIPWFLPFALHNDRWRFLGVYMLAKEATVLAAMFLVGMTAELAEQFPGFPIERCLFLSASFFMATYALMLFWEDKRLSSAPLEDETQQKDAKDTQTLKEARLLTASKVAIISTLGNVDSLGIFVPGLEQGVFSSISLLVSTALISSLVGAACIGFGQLVHISSFVNLVPLWFILLLLATWSGIEALII